MATRVSFSSFLYIFCWRCVHSSVLRMCKLMSRHKKGRKKKLFLLFVYCIQRQIGKILLMSSIINENRLKQHALFNLPPHLNSNFNWVRHNRWVNPKVRNRYYYHLHLRVEKSMHIFVHFNKRWWKIKSICHRKLCAVIFQ